MPRETTLLAMVLQAEPEHYSLKRNVIEYEFTAYGSGDPATHDNGMRVFRGLYDERGPYSAQTILDGGLVWNGRQIIWSAADLVWDED